MIRNFTLTRTDITDLAAGFGLGALSVITYVLAYLGVRSHFELDWLPLFSTSFVVFAVVVVASAVSLTELRDSRIRRGLNEEATTAHAENSNH